MLEQLYRIVREGITSPLYNSDGREKSRLSWIIYVIVVPIIVFGLSFLRTGPLPSDNGMLLMVSILTVVQIIALLQIPSKLTEQYIDKQMAGEKWRNHNIRITNMVKVLRDQMALNSVVGTILIIMLVVEKIFPNFIIIGLILALFYYFFLYILSVITIMYVIVADGDDNNTKQILND